MKTFYICILLFSASAFAVSPNWTFVSCAESANIVLDDGFADPYKFPERLNLKRSGQEVSMSLSGQHGIIRKDIFLETTLGNDKYQSFSSENYLLEVGIIGKVRTEIKIYKNSSNKKLLAHLRCTSN